MRAQPVVAVVGPGEHVPPDLLACAQEVGRLLARSGAVVLTGGRGGVMAAAAQGVRAEGGLVLGLLPGSDADEGNAFLTAAIPTGLGQARNAVVASADGLIAVSGSWGTLSEVALARRLGRPVVCVRGWQVRDHDGVLIPVDTAGSAADAVAMLLGQLDGPPGDGR